MVIHLVNPLVFYHNTVSIGNPILVLLSNHIDYHNDPNSDIWNNRPGINVTILKIQMKLTSETQKIQMKNHEISKKFRSLRSQNLKCPDGASEIEKIQMG